MVKNLFVKYTVSFFLSLVIILVQAGFVQTTHICGGIPVLSEFSIGESDLHCGGNKTLSKAEVSCEKKNHSVSKKPCCRNLSLSIQLDDKFQKKTFSEIYFISAPVSFVFDFYVEDQDYNISYQTDVGYILTKDIPIWNQSFLI